MEKENPVNIFYAVVSAIARFIEKADGEQTGSPSLVIQNEANGKDVEYGNQS